MPASLPFGCIKPSRQATIYAWNDTLRVVCHVLSSDACAVTRVSFQMMPCKAARGIRAIRAVEIDVGIAGPCPPLPAPQNGIGAQPSDLSTSV